ncbi:uncharacterized protein L3040_007108 [Drepanopeziza brunnea f. sp. 'multigermtubi']|nr:hypothetical protein L3040_007108 [Drepanopeziza brunnea f. sp. 'multigermtubi']
MATSSAGIVFEKDMDAAFEETTFTGDFAFRRTVFLNCTLRNVSIYASSLTNCELRDVKIYTSSIAGGTLDKCDIANSAVSKSTLNYCDVLSSKITTSQITHSTLIKSAPTKSAVKACEINMSPPVLRKFPIELRQMMFGYCLQIEEDNKSPALLMALRADKELYPEAIEMFYKLNYFTLNSVTIKTLDDLSPNAVMGIKNLCFDNRDGALPTTDTYGLTPPLVKASQVGTILMRTKCHVGHQGDPLWALRAVDKLRGVSKLLLECIEGPTSQWAVDIWDIQVNMLEKHLSVPGKLECEEAGMKLKSWSAEEGKCLRWH